MSQEQIPHPISQMPTHQRALPGTPIGILPAQRSAYCVGAEAINVGEQIGDVTGGSNPKNTGENELDLLGTQQHSGHIRYLISYGFLSARVGQYSLSPLTHFHIAQPQPPGCWRQV